MYVLFNISWTFVLSLIDTLLVNLFHNSTFVFQSLGIILFIFSSVSALSSSDLKYLLASESLFG
ncbi:hypothetical protein OM999_03180 [Mycoplasmopsis cynos]|uniref:hypothetical protein n=1 Tax=Mycoplasmopsis cynos TaxID=171284 RepID=UPI0024CD6E76|nr:hypothetical protein OM999_03180 [Mycoplasmopsis cynos]